MSEDPMLKRVRECREKLEKDDENSPGYWHGDVHQFDASFAALLREVLEEAAKECDAEAAYWEKCFRDTGLKEFGYSARKDGAMKCAAAIRAKVKP